MTVKERCAKVARAEALTCTDDGISVANRIEAAILALPSTPADEAREAFFEAADRWWRILGTMSLLEAVKTREWIEVGALHSRMLVEGDQV